MHIKFEHFVTRTFIFRYGVWHYSVQIFSTFNFNYQFSIAGAVAKYCDEYVCMCVCLSMCVFVWVCVQLSTMISLKP